MSVVINGGVGVTFPDSVTQTSGVPSPGSNANVLTSNGTIWISQAPVATTTIPAANLTGSTLSANVTSSTLTSVGTLTGGTWTANAVGVAYGGTGLTSTPANGALDIGNGTNFTRTTLTAGSGISITNGAGSISIAATGGGTVTSVATGNGLSGGTITTSGTLTIAAPTIYSVGSYVWGRSTGNMTRGSNYNLTDTASFLINGDGTISGIIAGSVLSGSWRWLGQGGNYNTELYSLAVRVS